ncbi:hypothetical protein RhiirA5_369031 [Rhizophagus irregularis]|uniref:mRNA cap guanine-N(7) methyltransferase n=1 Tax=Rhizophagus irregularis TaxID=588596 RepID=A0A2N0QED6_9GLOM|nr:hypothetical protein RhiirA5_369031 [Rhizophagus irregularis]
MASFDAFYGNAKAPMLYEKEFESKKCINYQMNNYRSSTHYRSHNNPNAGRRSKTSSLDALISSYKEVLQSGNEKKNVELEIRFPNLNYQTFSSIYSELLRGERIKVGQGKLSQTVSIGVKNEDKHARFNPIYSSNIREIHFEHGEKKKECYYQKNSLFRQFSKTNWRNLSYKVSLSTETPIMKKVFSTNGQALIRVKIRTSFLYTPSKAQENVGPESQPLWRIDATIVKELQNGNNDWTTKIRSIKETMFKTNPPMTAQNLLSVLAGTTDEYNYELEIEFVAPPSRGQHIRQEDIIVAADDILNIVNPGYTQEVIYQSEVYQVAQLLVQSEALLSRYERDYGLKQLLPKVTALTRIEYRKKYPPPAGGLYLTDKTDGYRALAIVRPSIVRILANRLYEFTPPMQAAEEPINIIAIVDGEFVPYGDREGEPASTQGVGGKFHAFDVITAMGEDVYKLPFEKRIPFLEETVKTLRTHGVTAVAKEYVHLVEKSPAVLEEQIKTVLNWNDSHLTSSPTDSSPYLVDGLILVEPGKSFMETCSYKWKGAEHNTIDFLARKAPVSLLGTPPFANRTEHTLYFLFVGITRDLYNALALQFCPGYSQLFGDENTVSVETLPNYFPVQFAPSVVEDRVRNYSLLSGLEDEDTLPQLIDWEMVRIRDDRNRDLLSKKYFGNNFRIAEIVWFNYIDPFPLQQLWEGPSSGYFIEEKLWIYKPHAGFVSYVKGLHIKTLANSHWVVDLGAGKGQDIKRYFNARIKNLVVVDKDAAALSELIRRKYNYLDKQRNNKQFTYDRPRFKQHQNSWSGRPGLSTMLHVILTDLTLSHEKILAKFSLQGLRPRNADAVVCNLAIHYLLGSMETLQNFAALVRNTLKPGGELIITAMFGELVHGLFMSNGIALNQSWDVHENGELKFSLRRKYASNSLEKVGQLIEILLPFTHGIYYEEFLVNTDAVIDEFVSRGFVLKTKYSLADALASFEKDNKRDYNLLTEGDKEYSSLYGVMAFPSMIFIELAKAPRSSKNTFFEGMHLVRANSWHVTCDPWSLSLS